MSQITDFLTEDQITEIFCKYLTDEGWQILSRATGRIKGADIVAERGGKALCIEAKGGGSQTKGSRRYGQPFNRLQCQKHTDVAFACLPRMMARYEPDYIGMVLPDDAHHRESVLEILPAIKKLDAGIWLISRGNIETLYSPF